MSTKGNLYSENITYLPMCDVQQYVTARMLGQWSTGTRKGATPMIVGMPGGGKSRIVEAIGRNVASQLGGTLLIHTVIPADREVTDFRGIGIPNRNPDTQQFDRITYTRSGALPTPEMEAAFDYILLFLDEVPAATLDHCKVLTAGVYDYKFGETDLDPGKYFVICAGNDPRHRSGAIRLPAHLVNRMVMLFIEPDVRAVADWMDTEESGVPTIAPIFLRQRSILFTEATIPDEANVPFCTFRMFTEGMYDLMGTFGDPDLSPTDPDALAGALSKESCALAEAVLSGYIGVGPAREFMAFARVADRLTPLEEIEADPEHARMPPEQELDATFAQASYVAAWITEKNATALITYVNRMRRDLRAPTIMAMYKKCPGIGRNTAFTKFSIANAGVMQVTLTK